MIAAGGAPLNIADGLREFARASRSVVAVIDEGRQITYAPSVSLVPTHAQMIRSPGADRPARPDTSSLDTLFFNAAALPMALSSPGTPGELYSRSPYLMNGYLRDSAATAACTTMDGFLTSGDVAIVGDEGYISIVDQVKDMIVTGGI